MRGRTPPKQLEREITEALSKRRGSKAAKAKASSRHHATKSYGFTDLIRNDDPNAMDVAEDFLLERGWKLREVTGALHARNFTIDMKPLAGPSNQWKMVQVSVYPAGKSHPGQMIAEYKVANGSVRVNREETMKLDADEAKKAAVATAWAIAKAIKPLPLSTSERQIKDVTNEAIDDGPDNLLREDLF
jgi:hypothetical protein